MGGRINDFGAAADRLESLVMAAEPALEDRELRRFGELESFLARCAGRVETPVLEQMLEAKGEDYTVIEPLWWPYEAVTFGAKVSADCLAVTGSGKPCTYTAYRGAACCGTHQDAKDPELLDWAHQWARIEDDDVVVAVCTNCHEVWRGGVPALLVDCPTCEAEEGDRCWNDDSVAGKSAPFPPHPERRRKAHMVVDGYTTCSVNPLQSRWEQGERKYEETADGE